MVTPSRILSRFNGTKVLVTGQTGFKGVWLCLWLQKLGANVIGFGLPPEHPDRNLYTMARLSNIIDSNYGDLRDLGAVTSVLERHQPEIIFHLGAQSLVRRSYAEPVETYATNVMGGVHLLEAGRRLDNLKAIVMVTTDKCYQNDELARPFKETDPMGGADPYSSSKGCLELVTEAYRHSFYAPETSTLIASARAGNVIGGGDWNDDRLIPDIVRSIYKNEPIEIRSPAAVRPWQHVLEPLLGYMTLASRLLTGNREYAESWNFGPLPGNSIEVGSLVEKMVRHWGAGKIEHHIDPHALHEATFLLLDTTKTSRRLGYDPILDIETTVKFTVDWYRQYQQDASLARTLCCDQIDAFEARLES